MAATMLYFHPADNVADRATVTTSGTANSSYPLANATDLSYALIASPSLLTGVSGSWVFDFGTAQNIDAAVIWHNFDAGLAVSLQGHTADSWASPTVSFPFTVPAVRDDGHHTKLFADLRAATSTRSLRYWRLVVTGSNTLPIGIKILLFSQVRTLVRNFRWGFGEAEQHAGIDMATDALVPWAYDLGAAPRRLSLEFIPTSADMLALRAWFRACKAFVEPTVIVPNPLNPDPFLCRLSGGGQGAGQRVGTMESSLEAPNYYRTSLAFDEITAGDPEWV